MFLFFFSWYCAHRDLHSFPTRRSSDLCSPYAGSGVGLAAVPPVGSLVFVEWSAGDTTRVPIRSEEHTSELQSRPHLVCRLLLEKKNKHTDSRNTLHIGKSTRQRSTPDH